jgi:exopolyphosphatase / guanosine-5'-triphosphate,3'-diphosphate pyrophosphatase
MASPASLKKRLAIIDLGSNSARLVVVQYEPGYAFRLTHQISRRVRLGEGQSASGTLQAAAMSRAVETMRMFSAFCAAHNVRRILPVATAAVRDAANRVEFLREIHKATGLRFRVLSGEQEAYYGVVGVINGLGLKSGLVMDVGGGSTELSRVRRGRFGRGTTTPLGAVRLTEAFLDRQAEQSRPSDVHRLQQHIDSQLAALDWLQLAEGDQLVGLGGTVRALARVDREARQYPLGLQNGYILALSRLDHIIERLAALPVSERPRQLVGLQPDRADIILAGAMVLASVMRRAGADALTVSGHGLREGLFFEAFAGAGQAPYVPNLRKFHVINLARLHGYDETHASHVTRLALSLFDQLATLHGYGTYERECLWAAGHLHDIGTIVDYYDHHKHSAYIILNAGLPAYSHHEIALIAVLCQFHRKGRPLIENFQALPRTDELQRIGHLAALLRLAEYLDRGRTQAVAGLQVAASRRKQVTIRVRLRARRDASVEIWEAQRNTDLFEAAYGRKLVLKPA